MFDVKTEIVHRRRCGEFCTALPIAFMAPRHSRTAVIASHATSSNSTIVLSDWILTLH